jgi:nucleoside 2-deoxyribosyltransferase
VSRVYLAGPDVFHPQAVQLAQAKRAFCRTLGLEALFPLDAVIEADPDEPGAVLAEKIYRSNLAMIEAADAVLANLTPFRGPSLDAGTAMEVGYAAALGKPVFGYSNVAAPFPQRTRAHLRRAPDGLDVEDFGPLTDNLMIVSACAAVFVHDAPGDAMWVDLTSFESAARAAAGVRRA